MHTSNIHKTFLLLIYNIIFEPNKKKPFSDICTAAKRLTLTDSPAALTTANLQNFRLFYQNNNQVIQTTFSASKFIYKQLHDLCTQETNKPLVMSLYHALLTQNLNIQSHLLSYAHHRHSDNTLIFPPPLPLLFSDKNTASDVAQT